MKDPDDEADEFLFRPDSQIWRLSREHALLLGGPAAAILQVAHPEVAAGVAAHSEFRSDAMGRLRRTLDAVYTITFATRAEADAMSRRVAAIHARVQGSHPVAYNAFSPAAQMWVLATLISVGAWIFEQVISSLSDGEREEHYRDMRIFGRCFGLDPAYGPQTEREFRAYYAAMLNGPELASIPLCREVAWAVARSAAPGWMRPLAVPFGGLIAETLPSPVRERLGFQSTAVSRIMLTATMASLRTILPVLPDRIRFTSHFLKAQKRIGR
jgi:uncharacterized protein (DUF2236 family)